MKSKINPRNEQLMRSSTVLFISLVLMATVSLSQTADTLEIYAIDVEGGKATLIVSPSRESLLIDTGNIDGVQRDAARILAAIKDAGLERIDHLVTTHWHHDHVGGITSLAAHIPILEFIDHGLNVQPHAQVDSFLQHTYPGLYAKSKHTVAKRGDRIPVAGLDVRVVASAGEVIQTALPAAGASNPYCAGFKTQSVDKTENSQSIGIHVTFGKFRLIDLGDLTANKEFDLMCPNNVIGTVDLFMVSHHGQPSSNFEVLVHAIESRVAIMNNGTRKGGQPEVMKVIHSSPGLEDLWQLHYSQLSGQEYTVPGMFIANLLDEPEPLMNVAPIQAPAPGENAPPAPVHNGTAYWIKVSARPDGSFTVTNSRNGFTKTYRARAN